MNRINLLMILLFVGLSNIAHTQDIIMVRSFVNDLSNDKIAYDTIIKQYICTDSENLSQTKEAEREKLLLTMLTTFRKKLKDHPQWKIMPYKKIPAEYQTLQVNEEEKQNIYAIQSKRENIPPGFILIKNGSVASFVAAKKGNHHFFLMICN